MERVPNRPSDQDGDAEEYPAGTEEPTQPPGVDPNEGEGAQPGFADDPPQAD